MKRPRGLATPLFTFLFLDLAACDPAGVAEPELELVDSPAGLRGRLVVDGETIALESTDVGGVRVSTVVSEQGTVHARWEMKIENYEISGTMGGRRFGYAGETEESDSDPSLWQVVADSRTGEVLRALSQAAASQLELGGDGGAEPHLLAFSRMASYLGQMAGEVDLDVDLDLATPNVDPACAFTKAYYGVYAACYASGGVQYVYSDAVTYAPRSSCERNYYVTLSNNAGVVLDSDTCDGPGCENDSELSGDGANAQHSYSGARDGITYVRRGKHWDAFVAPKYTVDSVTCQF